MKNHSEREAVFEGSMYSLKEKDTWPVSKHNLLNGKYFAGFFASEHIAATEFILGVSLVNMGVSTYNIIVGLLIGNILAMLSWILITAPIAVDVRLPLYWYIKKIAGKGTVLLYNILNCIVFTVIAGAMITASVSAVRILFNIPVQLNWYPQNVYFVIVALVLGMVVVLITIFGFKAVASLGTLSGPWLFTMFIVG